MPESYFAWNMKPFSNTFRVVVGGRTYAIMTVWHPSEEREFMPLSKNANIITAIPMPEFTADAEKRWQQVSELAKEVIMCNVWCVQCRSATTIQLRDGKMCGNSLVLSGTCKKCGGEVARVLEEIGVWRFKRRCRWRKIPDAWLARGLSSGQSFKIANCNSVQIGLYGWTRAEISTTICGAMSGDEDKNQKIPHVRNLS